MRRHLLSIALITILRTMPATAQDVTEITVSDPDAPRATIYAGYGGHGVDWEMAGDSRAFGGLLRFRGFVGQGRWVGVVDARPPAGLDPTVTRTGIMVMLGERPGYGAGLNAFAGLGVAAFIPRGVEMRTQFGTRIVLGFEAIADGWSVGPELQLDVPRPKSFPDSRYIDDGMTLMPTFRIGIALRKRF